ncbi:hypothetical protein R1flu_005664 [Riccia fluitans]|uniref:Uncharacterized protein n=1 Tax=Riccia fluitans TaxID=41844 RepID=A0ABD1YU25_9MARC
MLQTRRWNREAPATLEGSLITRVLPRLSVHPCLPPTLCVVLADDELSRNPEQKTIRSSRVNLLSPCAIVKCMHCVALTFESCVCEAIPVGLLYFIQLSGGPEALHIINGFQLKENV